MGSIIQDANYAKLNYNDKNSKNIYENLTPKTFIDEVNYNSNDIVYHLHRNNIESTNVADAITEIEGRVAQCGRKFNELEFGAGKDIDLLDISGNQITLDTYYIGNIVYFPKAQQYYMLLYSFTYGRSVLLSSNNGLLWQLDSDSFSEGMMYIDMKCNSQYLCFTGYNTRYSKANYSSATYEIFHNMNVLENIMFMYKIPRSQYDLCKYFRVSFDMDANSLLFLYNEEDASAGHISGYHINITGNISDTIYSRVKLPYEGRYFPKVLNINPGQYIYYMKGSKVQPKLMSLAKDYKVLIQDFPISNIYDVLLVDEFGCTTAYNNIYVRTDNSTNTDSALQKIYINSPDDITLGLSPSVKYAPPLLLAKRCCNNYIFFNNFSSTIKYWGYNNDFQFTPTMKSINDSNNNTIGDYVIATGFNPSFVNKINDKLFIYTNNEVNSTTLNNSKLYISQIKI